MKYPLKFITMDDIHILIEEYGKCREILEIFNNSKDSEEFMLNMTSEHWCLLLAWKPEYIMYCPTEILSGEQISYVVSRFPELIPFLDINKMDTDDIIYALNHLSDLPEALI